MKKKAALWKLLLLLACALALNGCGGKTDAPQAAASTCAGYADLIQAAAGGSATMDVTEKYLEKTLFIQAADLADWAFRRDGEGATPEMILVLRVKDGADGARIRQAVADYLAERTLQYRDYQPDQMYKLEKARVLARDEWICLSVTPDAEKARKALGDGWTEV